MKYSVIYTIVSAIVCGAPGALWCYFVHSWKHWSDRDDDRDFEMRCDRCGRGWHFRHRL